ncbi:hypothetical protein UFOVP1382_32 [uncultured Caudovirales phage]|uniref:Uncharacterized protein n=1 Tax=uncultured Caudovirales phage TaxID=2100421 RepID=A0A6J5S529_9CAUD|nr:hypothetical protein UFOVP1382_32 [uncultured Caudovirales phage]
MDHLIHLSNCHGEIGAAQSLFLTLLDAVPYIRSLRASWRAWRGL